MRLAVFMASVSAVPLLEKPLILALAATFAIYRISEWKCWLAARKVLSLLYVTGCGKAHHTRG